MRRASAALLATAVVGLLATAASAALATAATAAAAPPPGPPPSPAPPKQKASGPNLPASSVMPAVVVVGDGLTESSFSSPDGKGFGQQLQRAYTRRADVLNRGFGGFLTEWVADPKTMLPTLFPPACEGRTKLAVIFLGVKDSVTEAASRAWGRPYVPPEAFEQAVDRIVQAAQASGARRVVLVTPPPVCDALCSKPGQDLSALARNTANSQRYVDALRRVAAARDTFASASASSSEAGEQDGGSGGTKVRVLDIFSTWPKDHPADWPQRYLHEDRLHLSAGGHQRLTDDLLALLKGEMPDVAPTPFAGGQTAQERQGMLPLFWPHMDDVDMLDPAPSFEGAARRGGEGGGGPGACAEAAGGRAAAGGKRGLMAGGEASGEAGAAGGGGRGLRWVTAGLGAAAAAAAA